MDPVMTKAGTVDHSSGSQISGGVFSIVSPENSFVKVDNQGVYTDPLLVSFSGGNFPGAVPGSVATTAPASISSTAMKVKADGSAVMLEGDNVLMNCVCTPIPPASSPVTCSGNIEISDAGQTVMEAD